MARGEQPLAAFPCATCQALALAELLGESDLLKEAQAQRCERHAALRR